MKTFRNDIRITTVTRKLMDITNDWRKTNSYPMRRSAALNKIRQLRAKGGK